MSVRGVGNVVGSVVIIDIMLVTRGIVGGDGLCCYVGSVGICGYCRWGLWCCW